MKENDTSPSIKAILHTVTGDPPVASIEDLSGGSVKFIMRQSGVTTAKVDAAATIVDAVGGAVQYDWIAADTDAVGDFMGEFEFTASGGAITTYWDLRTASDIENNLPPKPIIIRIVGDLA